MNCPNCDAALAGRYCHACGQDNRRRQPRLGDVLGDALGQFVNFDSRLWRTIGGLTVNPGRVVRRYNDGHRVAYVNPLRYVVMMAALWWLVLYWVTPPESVTQQAGDPEVLARWVNGQLINLLAVPALAVPLWLAFLGGPHGLLQQLATAMFLFGHAFLWRAGLSGLGAVLPPEAAQPVAYVDFGLLTVYLLVAIYTCFRGRVRFVVLRTLGAVIGIYLASGVVVGWIVRLLVS